MKTLQRDRLPARTTAPSGRDIALIMVIAALVAALPAVWVVGNALDSVAQEIEQGRLRLAQLAAAQADRLVAEAFHDIETAANRLELAPNRALELSKRDTDQVRDLALSFGAGVALLDGAGRPLAVIPESTLATPEAAELIGTLVADEGRAVTMPWLDEATDHAMAALGLPIHAEDGTRVATLIGVLDLSEPLVADLIIPAARLGPSGHADLVDERGQVLASTEPGHVLTPGDHPAFYQASAVDRTPRVERVRHAVERADTDPSRWHVMAYAPLRNAPWGVAMGAADTETFAPIRRLRIRLIAVGTASLLILTAGTGLAWWGLARRWRDKTPAGTG